MNPDLRSISPLAAFLESYLDVVVPWWILVLAAIAVHWFLLLMPSVVAIGFLDRKLGADIQMRIGPNRASRYGILQSLADTIKVFFKEDAGPRAQENWLFKWGTIAEIVCVFSALASIPMAQSWVLSSLDSGVVAVLSALVFSHLCIFWATYSVESAWSVLSGFRILAMTSSYIVPIAIALVPPMLIAGSANFDQVVTAQGGFPWKWFLFHNPGTMLTGTALFLAMLIWQSRPPFDHFRADGEIAGGITAEYSGLRRGLLGFLEYISVFLACAIVVTSYLGGWQTPFNLESFGRAANLVQWLFFTIKIFALVFIAIWVRWSLPRLRIDQIVNLTWRVLVPIGLTGTIISAIWLVVFDGKGFGDFI